jgi:hypothetical protein
MSFTTRPQVQMKIIDSMLEDYNFFASLSYFMTFGETEL